MRSILLALLLSLAATVARAQDTIPLVERTALAGKVALLAPRSFGPMSAELLRVKYPTQRPPTEALSNKDGSINIAFGHTPNAVSPAQIREVHPVLERQIRATYPSARWSRSEVVERGGRSYIVLDFWSPTVDTEVRNIMLATSVDGRFLLVSFNVTRELEAQWGAIGERIMNSIRVVE